MEKSLTDIWLDDMPEEISYIIRQIIAFTQLVPPADYALHKDYLARCSKLLEIEFAAINVLRYCDEKDDYYYMSVIPLIEEVNELMEAQRKNK